MKSFVTELLCCWTPPRQLRISKPHFTGRIQVHWGWFMLSFIKLSALGTSLWQFIIFGCRNMLPFVVPHPTNIFFSQHKNLVNISLQIWFFFLFIYFIFFFFLFSRFIVWWLIELERISYYCFIVTFVLHSPCRCNT